MTNEIKIQLEQSEKTYLKNELGQALSELEDMKYALDQTAIVSSTDLSGSIIYVNDHFCKISKYSREELIGKNHRLINSNYHPKEFFVDLWNTIKSGKTWRGEVRNRAKDEVLYWVDTTIIPFTDPSGSPYKYFSIRVDITEKKCAEEVAEKERLRKQNLERLAALGEMAADISHEIRNPLAAVLLKAQLMKRNLSENGLAKAEVEKFADSIEKAGQRIEKIIQSVRGLSRDAKSDPFEETALKSIIDETIEFCKPRFVQGNVEFIVDDINDQFKINCRPVQISQVLINLLNNAYDGVQTLNEKWVKLQVVDEKDKFIIAVSDSGIGIPFEIRERIMQPFFTTKDVTNGSGLGLSISKGILELHGGSLTIDETKAHTTFNVELPKTDKPAEIK